MQEEFLLIQYHKDDQPFIGPGSQDMEPGKKRVKSITHQQQSVCYVRPIHYIFFFGSIFTKFHLMKSKLISEN